MAGARSPDFAVLLACDRDVAGVAQPRVREQAAERGGAVRAERERGDAELGRRAQRRVALPVDHRARDVAAVRAAVHEWGSGAAESVGQGRAVARSGASRGSRVNNVMDSDVGVGSFGDREIKRERGLSSTTKNFLNHFIA